MRRIAARQAGGVLYFDLDVAVRALGSAITGQPGRIRDLRQSRLIDTTA
jgi:hypothetical protein